MENQTSTSRSTHSFAPEVTVEGSPSPIEVWPVIHLLNTEQALANAALAQKLGCTGVFVIHMEGQDDLIPPVAKAIQNTFPALKVGVNFLSMPAHAALQRSLMLGLDATWSDRPGVRSDRVSPLVDSTLVPLLEEHPTHLFFASVAFKYQVTDPAPAEAACAALARAMVPTTSGEATGLAPAIEKIQSMRAGLTRVNGGKRAPLAIASGLTPDNIAQFRPLITHALVATGVSSDFYHFDEILLNTFVQTAMKKSP